jgi:hypothetical protein
MRDLLNVVMACVVVAFGASSAGAAPPVPPPSGAYTGEGLTLILTRGSDDSYTGTVSLDGKTYSLDADFDEDEGFSGTFEVGDDDFDFTAVFASNSLKFSTGGTTYTLSLAAAQPANPLAKKPPAPSVPAAAGNAAKPAGSLKLKRLSIKDPGINNIEAVSFLIPEGWTHEGGITWMHDYSILANLRLRISEPTGAAQIEFLPLQNFTWIDNPPFPMQLFSNYMGNVVHPPVRDAAEFVRTMYFPQALPHLQRARQVETERLESVERQYAAAAEQAPGGGAGGQASVYSGRVRYEFEHEGKQWEEDVYVFLSYYSGQGMTMWSVGSAYSFRAPRDAAGGSGLAKHAPLLTTIVNTARIGQDWFSGYMHVRQLFNNRQMQGIRDATRLSQIITENAEHSRKLWAETYAQRNASQDRINRSFGEYIRGVETYTNPYESREVQLPSGYSDAWVNPQGEYLLVGPGGFDPNVGSTVEWRRMKSVE